MKRLIIMIATVLVLVVLSLLVVGFESQRKGSVTPTPTPLVSPVKTPTPTSSPTASLTPTPSSQANIIVTSPKNGQEVTLPFTISGRARVFENQFTYQILNATGTVIHQGQIYANSPDTGQYGDFSVRVASVSGTSRGPITIEVFDYSAKDGSKIDVVKVPVTLK